MNLSVAEFVYGCVLLWFPRGWIHGLRARLKGRRRRRSPMRIRDPWKGGGPGEKGFKAAVEFSKLDNYLDLVRAAAGTVLLWGGWGFPRSVSGGSGAVALVISMVLVGVVAQTIRLGLSKGSVFPPVFYLAGVVFGLAGWQPALFSFVITWSLAVMLPNPQVFLFAFSVFTYAFGSMFQGPLRLNVISAVLLVFLPLLLSLLLNRPLRNHLSRAMA